MKLGLSSCFALALLLGGAGAAHAASQGTPGATSTGSVTITASITPEVSINKLDDLTFSATALMTALNTGRPAAVTDAFCLYSNNVDGSLYITATGDGAAGAFTLTDGTRTLPYGVQIAVTGNGSTRTYRLTAGTKSGVYQVSGTSQGGGYNAPADINCGGYTNAGLNVYLLHSDIQAMDSGTTYTGVLTLLVTPS